MPTPTHAGTRRRNTVLALSTVAAVAVTAGCGLQPAVYKSLQSTGLTVGSKYVAPAGSTATMNSDGTTTITGADGSQVTVDANGNVVDPGSDPSASSAPAATLAGGAPAVAGSTSAPAKSSAAPKAGASTAPAGGSTTATVIGINNTTKVIRIGIHAPETGAAPTPSTAFSTGAKLFWEDHTVFGYTVQPEVMDDMFNPTTAGQECAAMAQDDFLIFGAAGSGQIEACANKTELTSAGVPYFSDGTVTNGLTGLPDYFALSQDYAQQSAEDLSLVKAKNAADATGEWVIAVATGADGDDATASMSATLKAANIPFTVVRTKNSTSATDAATDANTICSKNPKNVYVGTAPEYWIEMEAAASKQLCTPFWTSAGLILGVNEVAQAACAEDPSVKASVLSPFPGIDKAPAGFAAEKNPAADTSANDRDLEESLYGSSEVIYQAMLNTGSIANLTRPNLIASMKTLKSSTLTVNTPVDFTSGTHFGSTGAWPLDISCSSSEWVTDGAPLTS